MTKVPPVKEEAAHMMWLDLNCWYREEGDMVKCAAYTSATVLLLVIDDKCVTKLQNKQNTCMFFFSSSCHYEI